jgi:hypothetical protein
VIIKNIDEGSLINVETVSLDLTHNEKSSTSTSKISFQQSSTSYIIFGNNLELYFSTLNYFSGIVPDSLDLATATCKLLR